MKRFFTILSFAVLCLTACDCPDCGNTVSSTSVHTVFVTKAADGTFSMGPENIILQSSCSWVAINMTPQYLDFANTNGTGGIHYLPVGLTPEFFAALAADINNFPVDATGERKIGTIHFDSDCEAGFDVSLYLKDFMVLNFNINGGDGVAPKPKGFVAGETVTIPENTTGMTFSPKTFVGWNTSSDGSGDFYKPEDLGTFTVNTTLYAMWSGDGSSASAPVYIYNHRTLNAVKTTLDSELHYLVVADFNANYDEIADVMHGSWEPIGDDTTPFIGVFEGNGHSIEYVINDEITAQYYMGLFGYVGSESLTVPGVIRNLTVDAEICLDESLYVHYAGGIVGYLCLGEISDCVSAVIMDMTSDTGSGRDILVGGIAGENAIGGVIQDVQVSGTLKATSLNEYGACVGGVAGNNMNLIKNASTVVTIEGISTVYVASSGAYTGGLAGQNQGLITLSRTEANVNATGAFFVGAGGAVGYNVKTDPGYQAHILNVYAEGEVDAKGDYSVYAGGAVGENASGGIIENVHAAVNVYTLSKYQSFAGGLVGVSANSQVKNVYASGNVHAEVESGQANAGGLASAIHSATLQNGYATGTVTSTGSGYVGGIVAWLYGTSSVNGQVFNCVALNSEITGPTPTRANRIIGYSNGTTSLRNNYAIPILVNGTSISTGSHDNTSGADCDATPPTATWWQTASNWAGTAWDFSTIWTVTTGGYPTLQALDF